MLPEDMKHFKRDYVDSFQLIPEFTAGALLWVFVLALVLADIIARFIER